MNETTGKTVSCMAITEKKPHRPGGCVGIFFQLFDWNRRFAKKKLFSRKLLPPVRAKQSTKKFGGDEKMPKTKPHLIADENCGGFPNVKQNGNGSNCTGQKREMRAAGLVVRLMGLESLPSVNRDKHKKASIAATCDVKEDTFFDNHKGSDIEVFNSGMGSIKVESRPQKLQKIVQFDKRSVTRFGAEALQIKNVLSRSRKHNHSKLASPMKSPRLSTSKNVSRTSMLIDAATRILEPGLQTTNRAKCALSYSNSMNYTPKSDVLMDGMGLGAMPADLENQQDRVVNYDMGVAKPFTGQSSCKTCGNLLEAKDFTPTIEKRIMASPVAAEKMSSQDSERCKPRPMVSDIEHERPEVHHPELIMLSSPAERFENKRNFNEDGKPMSMEDQVQWQVRSQQQRRQRDETSSTASPQKNDTRTDIGRSRVPPKAKSNNLRSRRSYSAGNAVSGAKDFVSLNRSLSSRSSSSRVSSKMDNGTSDTESTFCRRDDSLSQPRTPVRKRRTASVNAQLESTGIAKSKPARPKNIKYDLVGGKRLEPNAGNVGHECIKTRKSSQGTSNKAVANKDNDVVSFTFNSQLRHKKFTSSGINGTRNHIDKNASYQNDLLSEEKDGKTFFQRQMPLNGDSLGALLELKLKELTSQEEDELTAGGAVPKRSTAAILQELISALTAQQPFYPDSHMVNVEQTGGRARKAPVGFSHDGDYMSPGSVLEASFSNESCLSSSLDDCSVRRLLYDSMDYSCDKSQPVESDFDLLDSAISMNEGNAASIFVTDLLNCTSRAIQSIDLASGGLTGSRFSYVNEVILNAELLFSSTYIQNSDRMKTFRVCPFLFDNLEPLAGAIWTNSDWLLRNEDNTGGSPAKTFLFDCLIEYLDSKYGRCCNSRFKTWRRVQLFMNTERLIEEVVEEFRRWTIFTGMTTDEIVEWEMSRGLGKWTDFEIEEREVGADIDRDIIEVLVDETVKELWDCRVA